jgi:hypothetical protein
MMDMTDVVRGGKSTRRECEREENDALVDGRHCTMAIGKSGGVDA